MVSVDENEQHRQQKDENCVSGTVMTSSVADIASSSTTAADADDCRGAVVVIVASVGTFGHAAATDTQQ